MTTYTPDRWVVVELNSENGTTRKVLASWYGGYTSGDSWKLSSGITQVENFEDRYEFLNKSGSLYVCYKQSVGMSGYTSRVLLSFQQELSGTDSTIEVIDDYTVDK